MPSAVPYNPHVVGQSLLEADSRDSAPLLMRALASGFAAASQSAPVIVQDFRFTGRAVRLRIVGETLAKRLAHPFEHLRASFEAPELTIDLWDEADCGVARPIGDIRRSFAAHEPFADGVIAYDDGLRAYQTPRLATAFDTSAGRLVGWVGSAAGLSYFELGKPLQPLLFGWHLEGGVTPLHAALVAVDGKGLLLGGAGGSGKSTTSLTCARAGFEFLGDDYVGLTLDNHGAVRGHSFYASAWLESEHSRRLAWLSAHPMPGSPAGEPKQSFSVVESLPAALRTTSPIVAVGLPRVAGGDRTVVREISKAEALRRLAPSTVLQLPFLNSAAVFARAAEAVRRLPCYDIALGGEIDAIPAVLREIL